MKKVYLAAVIGLWASTQPHITSITPYRGQRENWQGRGKRPKPKCK